MIADFKQLISDNIDRFISLPMLTKVCMIGLYLIYVLIIMRLYYQFKTRNTKHHSDDEDNDMQHFI